MADKAQQAGQAATSPEIIVLLGRIAVALEKLVLHAFGEDLNPPILSAAEQQSLIARDDNSTLIDEETMAVVEMIEQSGREVPLAAYERLGIEPPNKREVAIDESAFDADQPGAHAIDDEIRAYKKKAQ